MMIISLEKLKKLWSGKGEFELSRVKDVLEILEKWDGHKNEILSMRQSFQGLPSDNKIGNYDGNWVSTKQRFEEFEKNTIKPIYCTICDVDKLFHIGRSEKKSEFRIASNAAPESFYERVNTNITIQNQESWFGTHNWPFEIARYYFDSEIPKIPTPIRYSEQPDKDIPPQKFVLKFLWMLANRNKYIPIFSIESFCKLLPVFSEVSNPKIDWGLKGEIWNLNITTFQNTWIKFSDELSKNITGKSYSRLNDVEKGKLMNMLFIASTKETTTKNARDMLQTGNQAMIFYGPPGTGKTYQAKEVARELIAEGKGEQKLVQFHPNYSYQDFIGGIMPKLNMQSGNLSYILNKGVFYKFCEKAEKAEIAKNNHESKSKYIFIIDEINRADLSSVLGELMYALEHRGEPVQIPNFGSFTIPKNVYIIGTMNSVDKSLVTFDLALRRRFLFFKLPPNMDVLNDWNDSLDNKFSDEDIESLKNKATAINDDLNKKLGLPQDYKIGQAYFMKIKDFSTLNGEEKLEITPLSLERLWEYHIEPLLEEYLGAEFESKSTVIKEMKDTFIGNKK